MYVSDKILIALLGALVGLLPQIYKLLKEANKEKVENNASLAAQLQQEGQSIRRELRQEVDSLKREIKELKDQNETQATEIDTIKNENLELREENLNLRQKVSDLEHQLREYTNNQG